MPVLPRIIYVRMSLYSDSSLDKDLEQWVYYPLIFDLMSILLPT